MSVMTLAIMNVTAVVSLRGLPSEAVYGPSSAFYYLFAAIVFLIPTALVAAEVAAMCERCPSIFALIVPPSEVTACREKLTVKGSAQHQALEAIEKFIRGGE